MLSWISEVVHGVGLAGIALLMLIENIVPPLPSELIMPLAGYVTRDDPAGFWGAVAAGTVGSLIGAIFWFMVARQVGEQRVRRWFERNGRWLGLRGRHIDRAQRWFLRHDAGAVLIGRLIPGVRVFVSLPAGFARMAWMPFLTYTTVGTLMWVLVLTYAGRTLGVHFTRVNEVIGLAAWGAVATGLAVATVIAWKRLRTRGLPPRPRSKAPASLERQPSRPSGRRTAGAAR